MSKHDYDISKIIDAYYLSFSGLVMQIRMCACCLKIMANSLSTSPVSLELLSVLCDWSRQGFCLFSFLPTRSSLTKHADKTSISAAHQGGGGKVSLVNFLSTQRIWCHRDVPRGLLSVQCGCLGALSRAHWYWAVFLLLMRVQGVSQSNPTNTTSYQLAPHTLFRYLTSPVDINAQPITTSLLGIISTRLGHWPRPRRE